MNNSIPINLKILMKWTNFLKKILQKLTQEEIEN